MIDAELTVLEHHRAVVIEDEHRVLSPAVIAVELACGELAERDEVVIGAQAPGLSRTDDHELGAEPAQVTAQRAELGTTRTWGQPVAGEREHPASRIRHAASPSKIAAGDRLENHARATLGRALAHTRASERQARDRQDERERGGHRRIVAIEQPLVAA